MLNGVTITITHSIVPIYLHSSINVIGMSRCANACQF